MAEQDQPPPDSKLTRSKQRIGLDRAVGQIECRGKLVALGARELEAFGRHGSPPRLTALSTRHCADPHPEERETRLSKDEGPAGGLALRDGRLRGLLRVRG